MLINIDTECAYSDKRSHIRMKDALIRYFAYIYRRFHAIVSQLKISLF